MACILPKPRKPKVTAMTKAAPRVCSQGQGMPWPRQHACLGLGIVPISLVAACVGLGCCMPGPRQHACLGPGSVPLATSLRLGCRIPYACLWLCSIPLATCLGLGMRARWGCLCPGSMPNEVTLSLRATCLSLGSVPMGPPSWHHACLGIMPIRVSLALVACLSLGLYYFHIRLHLALAVFQWGCLGLGSVPVGLRWPW